MDRYRGDVLGEIAQRRLENRFGVIADAPDRALAGLFNLPGNGTGIVGYRALKRSADDALPIDRELKEHDRVTSILLCEGKDTQRHPFRWLIWI